MSLTGATQLSCTDLAGTPTIDQVPYELPLRETTCVAVNLKTNGGRNEGTPPPRYDHQDLTRSKFKTTPYLGEFAIPPP